MTADRVRLIPFRSAKGKRVNEFPALEASKTNSGSPRSIRCAQFFNWNQILSVQNDHETTRAYFVWYFRPGLDAEMPWTPISPKPLPANIKRATGMDICRERSMVVVAASDMSVHIFNVRLQVQSPCSRPGLRKQRLLFVPSVADFTVTQIAFNPTGSYLACGSVANTVAFVGLDEYLGASRFHRLVGFLDDYGGFIIFLVIIFIAWAAVQRIRV